MSQAYDYKETSLLANQLESIKVLRDSSTLLDI
jgi:hypothetical protein